MTGIDASLYRGGRTLQSLLRIGVPEKEVNNSEEAAQKSCYSPRSQRAELTSNSQVFGINEASIMSREIF